MRKRGRELGKGREGRTEGGGDRERVRGVEGRVWKRRRDGGKGRRNDRQGETEYVSN